MTETQFQALMEYIDLAIEQSTHSSHNGTVALAHKKKRLRKLLVGDSIQEVPVSSEA